MSEKSVELYNVIRHLRPAFKHISRLVEIRSEQAGLSVGTRAVLEQLVENGPKSVPDMARSLMVERQYIQRCVNSLLTDGLVSRTPNPAHKKSWLIDLEKEGRDRFQILKIDELAILDAVSASLSPSEIRSAIKVMAALSDNFHALVQEETGKTQPKGDKLD